jgi:hypothetical protein
VWAGLGLNFMLLVFLGGIIRDDIAARRKVAAALEGANAILEQKVLERTAELVMSNERLKAENLERQWTEQALAHQLHYSNLIINLIDDQIFVISGYDSPEIIGNPLFKILDIPEPPAGDSMPPLRFVHAVKEGREIQGGRGSLLCKNGIRLPMWYNMVPLRDQNKVVGSVLMVRLLQEDPKDNG